MRARSLELLTSRRFAPLFVTQFLGAFNDNLLKSALAILATYRLAARTGVDAGSLVMIAGGVFIAPFFLFSGASGTLADRSDKASIARWVKTAEIAIMAIGGWGLWIESLPMLLTTLFCLGTHSTVFGPVKYALLPQHLRGEELVTGNALIEAGTFLAILLGTVAGGSLVLLDDGAGSVAMCGIAVACAGWLAARHIPPARPDADADAAVRRPRWLADSITVVRYVAGRRALLLPILAISWFWLFGATVVSALPVFARDVLVANEHVVTLMLAVFAIGVGCGSALAERILDGEVSARHVPAAALMMGLFAIDLHTASAGRPAGELVDIAAFLHATENWRVLIDLAGLAAAGGVFCVPVYAVLQHESEPRYRARVIAANNIVNALAMAGAAVAAAWLASGGATMGELIAWCGIATLLVAMAAAWVLRRDLTKSAVRFALRLVYRVRVEGAEHVNSAMPKAVIAANHASFLDGLLLGAFLPGNPIFAVDTHVAKKWWAKPFLALVHALPVDPGNPLSIRAMIRAVEAGASCIIFPEGRITTTGALMKVYEGPAVIAGHTGAALVPVRIEGAEFTPFSRLSGKVRRRLFPRIRVRVLPPVRLTAPEGSARGDRAALRRALADEMVKAAFTAARTDTTLFDALLDAVRQHGGGHVVADDPDQQPISYRGLVTASYALGAALARRTGPAERVGVLLPTSKGALVTFFALQATGRVPAMLNFSAGSASVRSACRAAEVSLVLTSRRFVEKAKLDGLVAALAADVTVVYLEDVRAEINVPRRVVALLRACAARPRHRPDRADAAAVVLFTSGSEGTPKGVVLSHRNLLSNRHQMASVVDVNPKDVVLNALPVFHSFGLTGGMLLPLLAGVRTFHYPSPLHYRTIPECAYATSATILFGTDTFLAGYAREADNYDFYSMRYVFAGAERVKAETRRIWFERFGIRILEGYGATETAPAIAVNTPMHFKSGTVGRLLPAIEHRLEQVEGITDGGRLFVRGPNVMLGYVRAEAPGVLEPPAGGWYDTGDIVDIDADGFVTIRGRAKRFAKVAGEMVPLGAVEDLISSVWPGAAHAVIAVPDDKRGEQLVLVTDGAGPTRAAIAGAARTAGLPEIFVPRTIVTVEGVPLLATGKIDYVGTAKLVAERASQPT